MSLEVYKAALQKIADLPYEKPLDEKEYWEQYKSTGNALEDTSAYDWYLGMHATSTGIKLDICVSLAKEALGEIK